MTLTSVTALSSVALTQTVTPALRTLVVAAAAALGLTAFRVKSTSQRLAIWTSVLCAGLAMPFLGWMLPAVPVPVPLLNTPAGIVQQKHTLAPVSHDRPQGLDHRLIRANTDKLTPALLPLHTTSLGKSSEEQVVRPSTWSAVPWSSIAFAIYVVVGIVLLTRLLVAILFSRRLKSASREISDSRLTCKVQQLARELGIRSFPRVAESDLISVPVTVGAVQSSILLPPGWQKWEDAKLDAVLAHEISHVARHDGLTQRLSILHRTIFWFSPFAWWLDRHLANLAEQASDETALSCGTDRNDYARVLLGFFEDLQISPRVWWQGVAMAKRGQAVARVERILAWRGAVAMGLRKSAVLAFLMFAIPVVYLAAAVHPAHLQNEQSVSPAPAATPDSPVAPRAEVPPAPALAPPSSPQDLAPTAPLAPVASDAPITALAAPSQETASSGDGYSYGYDDDVRFVIVTGKTDSLTMSGSSEDAHHVEKLRKQIPGDFIWFQRDEKSYIIRDQATVDRARKLWLPQEEIGKKQEALGKQQEALGKQQEALGARMEQIRVNVPDMTAELEKLKAELKALSSGATVEQIGKVQEEIGELQSRIGQVQSSAGDEQSKLGEEMGALGEKQGKLGEQQGELGFQQSELARRATVQMKQILDEAIKSGKAQPEPEMPTPATL